jgi:hypothetical protein
MLHHYINIEAGFFMRFLASCALVLSLSCAAFYGDQKNGAKTAEEYSAALLTGDNNELRSHLSSDAKFEAVGRNASLAALHVIRTCPQSEEKGGLLRRVLVLIGGGLKEAVYGVDVTVIKEGPYWKVKYAQMARDPHGAPLLFLRNCSVDLTGTSVHYGGDSPSQMFIPTIITPTSGGE